MSDLFEAGMALAAVTWVVVVVVQLIKKAATNDEKAKAKAEKEQRQDFYGYAIVDGRIEKVS